ncbi:hypothetical protein ABTP01_11590 [Acinetobacter baumannii]
MIDNTITFLINVVVAIIARGIKLRSVKETNVDVGFIKLAISTCLEVSWAKQLILKNEQSKAINTLLNDGFVAQRFKS